MKGAVSALLLILPTLACAEGTPGREFSFFSSFLQMIAALSIVVGLILVTRHFSGKLLGGAGAPRFASKHIRIVETRPIAPKKALILIEVGGEYMLLASTEEHLTLLKQVDLLEEIEVLEETGAIRPDMFRSFLRNAKRWRG